LSNSRPLACRAGRRPADHRRTPARKAARPSPWPRTRPPQSSSRSDANGRATSRR